MYNPSSSDPHIGPATVGIDSSPSPLDRISLGSSLLPHRSISSDGSWLFSVASSSNRFTDVSGTAPQLQARKLERLNSRKEDDSEPIIVPPSPMLLGRPFERRPKRCWSEYFSFVMMCSLLTLAILGSIIYIMYITMRPEMPRYEVRDVTISAFTLRTSYNSLRRGESRTLVRQFEFGLPELNILAINPSKYGKLHYHPSIIHVYYEGIELGNATFPRFVQKAKRANLVRLAFPTGITEFEATHGLNITSDFQASFIKINVKGSVTVGQHLFGMLLGSPVSSISCYMNVIPTNSTLYTPATVASKSCS